MFERIKNLFNRLKDPIVLAAIIVAVLIVSIVFVSCSSFGDTSSPQFGLNNESYEVFCGSETFS